MTHRDRVHVDREEWLRAARRMLPAPAKPGDGRVAPKVQVIDVARLGPSSPRHHSPKVAVHAIPGWKPSAPPARDPWSDRYDTRRSAPPANVQPLVIGGALAALGILAMVGWQLLHSDGDAPADPPAGGPPELGGSGRILAAARRIIPCAFGTPLWDKVLGGAIGPGRWKLYEEGYGTTCGIVAGYVLEEGGADLRFSNRGDRFKVGQHISRLYEGGKATGALRMDANLAPGDVYYVLRDGAKAGVVPEHVGIVLERDGERLVTGDGGQTDAHGKQCALVMQRRIQGNRIIGPYGNATCMWRLSFGG